MTGKIGRHMPTPDFRNSLEQELVRALRTETEVVATRRHPRLQYLKQAAVLLVGLALGMGTQIASAQVQDRKQRTELESTIAVDRDIAALRLQVAREEHERVRKGFDVGALSRQSLLTAAAEMRTAELALARIDLDLAEVRATNAAPRNELWAPLVAGRDYVRERLRMELAAAQELKNAAEQILAESHRSFALGVVSEGAHNSAREEVARANRNYKVLATRLTVRDAFLKEQLEPAEATRRAQRLEVMLDLDLAQQRMAIAQERLKTAQRAHSIGLATLLEVKRAEVDVLERTTELGRLQSQLRSLR